MAKATTAQTIQDRYLKGEISPTAMLWQEDAASILRMTVRNLTRLRAEGTGPAFIKLGHRIGYRMSDINVWLEGRIVRSNAEATKKLRAIARQGRTNRAA